MMHKRLLALISIILIFVPAAVFHAQGDQIDPVMAAIIDAAMGSLSQKLGKPQSRDITPWHIAGDAFNDTSLDCPAAGQTYAKQIVRGYRIRITAPSQTNPGQNFDYQYRSTLDGSQLFECTPQGPGPNIPVILPTPIPVTTAGPTLTPYPTATPIMPPQAQATVADSKSLVTSTVPVDVRWSVDGSKVIGVVIPAGTSSVQIVDLEANAVLETINTDKPVASARLSPDSKWLAVATLSGHFVVFDATTGQQAVDLLQMKDDGTNHMPDLIWDAGATHLAAILPTSIMAWDVKVAKLQFSKDMTITSMALWSPDSSLLVTNYGDGATQSPIVLDATNGSQKFALDAVAADVKNVVWGPNGRSIAVVGKDESIAIFNGTTGARLRNINGHAIQWSPDGTKLASATFHHATNIYDTGKGTVLLALDGGPTIENIVVFSPDGKRLATADDDGTIRIWDVATGTVVVQLDAHQPDAYQLEWKADGTQLLSFGRDNTIRLWNLPQS